MSRLIFCFDNIQLVTALELLSVVFLCYLFVLWVKTNFHANIL